MTRSRKQHAFTVVELIVSMTLMAIILAALSVAMQAAFYSYEENQQIADLNQSARGIMDQIAGEIRVADNVDCQTNMLKIYPNEAGGPDEIRYVLEGGVFYLRTITGSVMDSHVLLGSEDNVTVKGFAIDLEQTGDTTTLVKFQLDLACGDETFTVISTAAPRKNQ
jgi:prepilin-type N-terminal cleavage/methylation domain-containing protein